MKLSEIPRRSALVMIRFYKGAVSPYLPPSCRFSPTCSQYAATAIERFGVVRGGAMAAKRILRCNPFHEGGYDPVPDLTDTENRDV